MKNLYIVEKWNYSKENELLVNEVLNPLLKIVYLYKESSAYNYAPGTETDIEAGWKYFEKKFNEIFVALNSNVYISKEVYAKAKYIVIEMKKFVTAFSGADGLAERYFEMNPNLRFYRTAFKIWEEDKDTFLKCIEEGRFTYVPGMKDLIERKEYMEKKNRISEDYNFKYTEEDFFMEELAYALRMIFLKEMSEFAE